MNLSTENTINSTDNNLRSKMIKTALLGGLVLTIVFGIHGYFVEPKSDSIIHIGILKWVFSGVVVGLGIGVLAQLPTTDQNSWIRLGQAAIQGFARGLLFGFVMQSMISLGTLLMVQKGVPPRLALLEEAMEGISSFAFCGVTWGILAVMQTIVKKFRGDRTQALTIVKFAVGGAMSTVIFFGWLVFTQFPFDFLVLFIFAFVGMVLGAIIGLIPAANQ